MTKAYDPETGEINPGTVLSDPDYGPETWDMPLEDYLAVIENYAGDVQAIAEVMRNMPPDIYDEYAALDFPDLPEELRPDYEEPQPEEEQEEE